MAFKSATLLLTLFILTTGLCNGEPYDKDELSELRSRVKLLESIVVTLNEAKVQIGVSYTRWGRHSCKDSGAQLLYKGYAAGPHHTQKGGGSNLLCVSDQPQWKRRVEEYKGLLYGLEYHIDESKKNIFSVKNNGGYTLRDHPAACAVCYVPRKTSQVMIPARVDCPAGWTREYAGYLASDGSMDSKRGGRSSYVCWDEAPETASGASDQNQAHLVPVHVGCGSLPCSKFRNDWPLTCVVCIK